MLSKIIILAVGLFIIPSTAEAHNRHHPGAHKPSPTVVVTLGWTWVEASLFRQAHWHHPSYGRSHRAQHAGPPPARPYVNATWVPGHWQGRGRHRHWTPGHWRR